MNNRNVWSIIFGIFMCFICIQVTYADQLFYWNFANDTYISAVNQYDSNAGNFRLGKSGTAIWEEKNGILNEQVNFTYTTAYLINTSLRITTATNFNFNVWVNPTRDGGILTDTGNYLVISSGDTYSGAGVCGTGHDQYNANFFDGSTWNCVNSYVNRNGTRVMMTIVYNQSVDDCMIFINSQLKTIDTACAFDSAGVVGGPIKLGGGIWGSSASYEGTMDEVYYSNGTAWNQTYINQLYNNGAGWNPFVSTALMSDIIVVNNSFNGYSINYTSEGGYVGGFSGTNGTYKLISGNDSTSTFNFVTKGSATCKIWNESKNYTTLAGMGVPDCGTTGATNQVCTFSPKLKIQPNQTIYISCKSGVYEMNTFNDSNLFNFSAVDTISPVCVLQNRTPTDINASSTGLFQVLLNCTDDNGINVTLSNGHFRAFNTRTIDGFLTPGLPNRWSVRYPANNISSIDVDYPAYGKILRALGRNKGYWFDSLNYNLSLNNDTFSYAVNDGIYGRFKINSTGLMTALTNFTGIVEMVFRQNIYLSYEAMVAELKKEYTISTTDRLLVQFLDYETVRQSGNYSVRYFINLNNTGSTARTLLIYYCNKTYTPVIGGVFSTSPYCVLLDSLSVANVNTRVFFDSNSSYVQIQFSSINGKIDGITATDLGYIGFVMSGTAPIANRFKMKYMNGSIEDVNMTFAQTKVAWTSTNSGTTWSQANWTPDMFLTSIKAGNDEFDFGVYVEDLYGNAYLNLSIIRDVITDTIHPISNPFIQQYNSTFNPSDTDKNGTHSGLMYILIDPAISPDYANGNVTHNLTLRNPDGTINRTILVWNTTGPQPVWILFNTTSVPNGLYRTNVSAYPLNNFNDVKSYMTSDNFTINNIYFIYLDGAQVNRTYEYGQEVEIMTTYPYVTILDETDNYINYSVQNNEINYLINILRKRFPDFSVNTSLNVTILTYDNRTELYNASMNITALGNISNLTIVYNNKRIDLPGKFIGDKNYQNVFIYSGTEYVVVNLSFDSAGTKIVYINFSGFGKLTNRSGYHNWTITGYSADVENAFNYNKYFWDNVNDTDVIKLGTWYPIGNLSAFTSPKANIFEPFTSNITNIYWHAEVSSVVTIGDVLDFTKTKGSGCTKTDVGISVDNNQCIYLSTPSNADADKTKIYSDFIDWNDLDYATFQLRLLSNSNKGQLCLEFTDLTNVVIIRCTGFSAETTYYFGGNFTMSRTGTDTWDMSFVGLANYGGYSETVNTATLNRPYYLRIRDPDGEGSDITFANLNYGGIYVNKTNMSFSGIEGGLGNSHSGNFTTHILNTTTGNVTRATLTYYGHIPSGTSVSAYLSNNNGSTFESAINGTSHLFLSKGNQIRAKFILNSTYNYTSPIITRYAVVVTSTALTGLNVDVGCEGANDYSFLYTLNSSTTPIQLDKDSYFNSYLNTYCDKKPNCLVPYCFKPTSGGTIGLSNLNITENINPIPLNYTYIQNQSTITINTTFSTIGTGNVTYKYFIMDYYGSKNISVIGEAPGNITNLTMFVKYSKFNISLPYTWTNYIMFMPKTNDSKNVTPYGQSNTIPIEFIKGLAYEEGMVLGLKVNQSLTTGIPECVNLTIANISNRTLAMNLSFNYQIFNNLSTPIANTSGWMWADLNQCNASIKSIYVKQLSVKSCCLTCYPCWS